MAVSFTTDRMLNFGDCDISGTAYYPSYLNILNGVIEEFWTAIGYPWHEIIWKDRWGTPTVHCGEEARWSGHQVLAASWLDKHTSMPWPEPVRDKLLSFLPAAA